MITTDQTATSGTYETTIGTDSTTGEPHNWNARLATLSSPDQALLKKLLQCLDRASAGGTDKEGWHLEFEAALVALSSAGQDFFVAWWRGRKSVGSGKSVSVRVNFGG